MIEFGYEKALRTKIALASDALIEDARQFMQNHKSLFRDLTNAQLYGLLNVVRNISKFDRLRQDHAQHQLKKAAEAGRKIEVFWRNWDAKLVALQEKAKEIAGSVNSAWVNDHDRIDGIAQTLRIKYVQHLIAMKYHLQKQN